MWFSDESERCVRARRRRTPPPRRARAHTHSHLRTPARSRSHAASPRSHTQSPPELMLPLLYVLDSIVFNDASRTYEAMFGANIVATFQRAFSSVPISLATRDNRNVREKIGRLVKMWRTRPQFEPRALQAMLGFVASSGAPPPQQQHQPPPPRSWGAPGASGGWQQPPPHQPQPAHTYGAPLPHRAQGRWGARAPPSTGAPPPQPYAAQRGRAGQPGAARAGGRRGQAPSARDGGAAASASAAPSTSGSAEWGDARDLIDAMYAGLPHQCVS